MELLDFLIDILSFSEITRVTTPLLISIGLYVWGFKRQRTETQWHYSTEFILFLGVMFTGIFLWQLGELLDNGSGNIAPLFLIGCAIYGIIGFISRSSLVWLFFLLTLGSWFGAQTGYASGWGAYWLGMNYPIRFVLFGCVLLAGCYFLQKILKCYRLFTITKIMGLTYLFIALWILSIFGSSDNWFSTTSEMLFPWVLLFGLAAFICIYLSLSTDDGMLRGFGLTFLGINLYTRYFEYFWSNLHSVIFFSILAVSLIYIGIKAEKIWHSLELDNDTLESKNKP